MQTRSDGRSPRIAAVVLAAGCSRRMGRAKLLLPFRGRAIIADVVDRVRALASPVIVVTGHEADTTAAALSDLDVQLVHNNDYADGEMLSSVKAGVAALPPACDAFFLVLGDQPGIAAHTFRRLIDAWQENPPAKIISPVRNNRRGHPILIAADGVDEILNLPADATLKTFVSRRAADSIEVEADDPAVLADVDTPQQYERLIQNRSLSCPTEAIVGD